jgi:hypothetical protein
MADQAKLDFLKRRKEQAERELAEAEREAAPPPLPPPPAPPRADKPDGELPATSRAVEILAKSVVSHEERIAKLEAFQRQAEELGAKLKSGGLFPSFGKKGS